MGIVWPIRLLFFCATFLLGAVASPLQSERILDFQSAITLEDDSSLLVTETITINANDQQIRHGIYRDFPTTYTDPYNNRYVVGFEMISATRDSLAEPFRVEDHMNGKRIYLGDPNALLGRGRHTYTFTYRTNQQLGFFKDHEELFWNVTGLGWDFPIDRASASVILPSDIPQEQVKLSGFTGPQGSREAQLSTSTYASSYQFTANRPLRPHEGLTILLMWPKGFVKAPTFAQRADFFLRANRGSLILVLGFFALLIYYILAWSAVGRDPQRGVIMPLYEPPVNLSPAGMRYLMRMGFDNKTFAAAILDMAARGYLKIHGKDGFYNLSLNGAGDRVLTPDEKDLASVLFSGRTELLLEQANHTLIHAGIVTLQKWLNTAENKVYFVTNSKYLIAPVILSVLTAFIYLGTLGAPQVSLGVFLTVWLTMWTFGTSALVFGVIAAWKAVIHSRASVLTETIGIGKALFTTLFSIPFIFGEVMGFAFLWRGTSLSLVIFVLACGLLHLIYLFLLKAPTMSGRRLMDQVEGFKLFLRAVHGDSLNRMTPPQQTPEVFERFLPYALALNVEQEWAEQFSGVLATAGSSPAGTTARAYSPSFYSGDSWSNFSGTNFASSFTDSFTSAISASSSAPGSGSGGGGGGSGGGGGGGGGGGW